jgi:hypothetical protein
MLKGMYSRLPRCVFLKNERFIINTDFRIFITFEEEMTQDIDTKKACYNALRKFYPAFSLIIQKDLLKEAVEKFIWFYQCGKKEIPTKKKTGKGSSKEAFRYSYDDLYIWGAFKCYFNVDLSKEKIHWWMFRAMWLSLPSDAEFTKIKGYRVYDGKDKDLLALKELYSLPPNEKEIKNRIRQDKIYESLK